MEVPEWLVLPVFSGAIALAINWPKDTARLDSSEKFIINSALLGILPSLLVLSFRDFYKFYVPFSSDVASLINLIWASFLAYILQFLLTRKVQEITEDSPQISNQLERSIVTSIRFNETCLEKDDFQNLIEHMIELKNGKIYVGFIEYVDVKDSNPITEKFLSFIPSKSGFRSDDGSVEYASFYYPEIKDNESKDDYEKRFDEISKSVQTIFVPLSEVISIREYNLTLNDHFGHE